MPEVVEVLVYRLGELSAPARERARAWYREHAVDPDWHEPVLDDFEAICALLGVTLATAPVRLMGGSRPRPRIFFSGFCSQGDGASFEGFYNYRRGATALIRQHAPMDTSLHRIAAALQAVQRRHFYDLRAEVRHQGRYVHERTMAITVARATGEVRAEAADVVVEALRDLARWLYRQARSAADLNVGPGRSGARSARLDLRSAGLLSALVVPRRCMGQRRTYAGLAGSSGRRWPRS